MAAALPDRLQQAAGTIRSGYHARICSSFDLAQDFTEAEATGEHRELVAQLTRVVPATTAILDRFLEHAKIAPMNGKFYRLRRRTRDAEKTPAEDE
jgi:hypothetical protein